MSQPELPHTPDISIVIPVKDEEESVDTLAMEIEAAMATGAWDWECIWVDDGSTDGSLARLKSLARANTRHRYLSFSRNSGQSAALWAGFSASRGAVIATLDADGQNDPADLPKLLRLMEETAADIVNGYRERRADSIIRKISSRIGNGFRNLVTGRTVRDVGCSTRCFRRECVRHLPPFKGMHRFLPTLMSLHGYRFVEVPVNHRPRDKGHTKYSIHNRLWVGIHDLFGVRWFKSRAFSYSVREQAGGEEERE